MLEAAGRAVSDAAPPVLVFPSQNEVTLLRNEVAQLKQLLLAHKDCPVTALQKKTQGYLGECWLLPVPAAPEVGRTSRNLLKAFRKGAFISASAPSPPCSSVSCSEHPYREGSCWGGSCKSSF